MGWEFELLYFLQKLHTPWLDQFLVRITGLSDHGEIWIALALAFLCFKKSRKMGIAMIGAMALSFLAGNVLLKNMIGRSRPCWIDSSVALLIDSPKDYSFPSGHTLVSFTASVSIYLQNRRWGLATLLLAVLITFSRLYLFVHFPTDILGGAVLGIASAFCVNHVMKKWKMLERQEEGGGQHDFER
ncbi:MAG: phosphatase PAP2 family protein [Clostridiaceae bacterium]|nr:phosphatase PAP2 family protein [Clostridiaceae bacterium]